MVKVIGDVMMGERMVIGEGEGESEWCDRGERMMVVMMSVAREGVCVWFAHHVTTTTLPRPLPYHYPTATCQREDDGAGNGSRGEHHRLTERERDEGRGGERRCSDKDRGNTGGT